MFLDDKSIYEIERSKLFRMSIEELEVLIGELYDRRVNRHDIEIEAYYRLAGWVLNQRTKQYDSLIFHIK